MKIATWNVNGIRARQDQVAAFVDRERPDVLCLQEIKAARDHIPKTVSDLPGYWCYWHGTKGYSGVALIVKKELAYDQPLYIHPEFDHETRIAAARVAGVTVASVYVPNGGKDFAAKVRFLEAMAAYGAALRTTGDRVVLCGDINIARSERDVHPRERKPGVIGQRSDERALFGRILEEGDLHDVGARAGTGERRALHLVGALAEHARAKHRLAARLRASQRRAGGTRHRLCRHARIWHQRPWTRDGDLSIRQEPWEGSLNLPRRLRWAKPSSVNADEGGLP